MAKKVKYTYIGESYKQGSSDMQLFSFCAPTADIYAWGGVPAKTERFHGGFQRALSDRHKSIKKFFDDGQASPTSIVVAFREGVLKTTALGYPESWPTGTLSNHPQFVYLSFEFDELSEEDALDTLRKLVCELLSPRLQSSANEDEPDGDENDEQNESESEVDPEGDQEADEEQGNDFSDELDVGHSKLKDFYNFIADKDSVSAWLASETARYNAIKKKGKPTKRDQEFVQIEPEKRLKLLLISLLRPATIVDGQHRVWGSYFSEQSPIIFNVCAIKDTSWIEQVFQFVVLNKLAKPISTSFLTGLLNTSLTNSEVKEIENRLETIGIRNTERVIVKYLNHDARSPFVNMVAEAGEVAGIDNRGRLSDKGMIRLARRWKAIAGPKLEISMFLKALGKSKLTEARLAWKNYETWMPYFYSFWSCIKGKYEKEGIWVKSDDSALLYIVTMHAMQDLFISTHADASRQFDGIDDFSETVTSFFEDVPATFFQGWKATGLQSGDGPEHIQAAVKQLRSGKSLATVRKESFLFQDPAGK